MAVVWNVVTLQAEQSVPWYWQVDRTAEAQPGGKLADYQSLALVWGFMVLRQADMLCLVGIRNGVRRW